MHGDGMFHCSTLGSSLVSLIFEAGGHEAPTSGRARKFEAASRGDRAAECGWEVHFSFYIMPPIRPKVCTHTVGIKNTLQALRDDALDFVYAAVLRFTPGESNGLRHG